MKDLFGVMKQAKELQDRMQRLQDEVASLTVEGTAGGGLVRATLNGKGEMKAIKIDPSLLKPEEVDILEDLIVAAINEGRARAESKLADKMRELTGGLALPPGMKLPF
jgi:DNA-binding YbaB/EbfC family protein